MEVAGCVPEELVRVGRLIAARELDDMVADVVHDVTLEDV